MLEKTRRSHLLRVAVAGVLTDKADEDDEQWRYGYHDGA